MPPRSMKKTFHDFFFGKDPTEEYREKEIKNAMDKLQEFEQKQIWSKEYKDYMEKEQKGELEWEFIRDKRARVRKPKWDYRRLLYRADTNWVVRRTFEAIIRQATFTGYKQPSKFKASCSNPECNWEYDYIPETGKCHICNAPIRPPDPGQFKLLRALMDKPNGLYSWDEMMKSLIYYSLAVDDWWISISFKYVINAKKTTDNPWDYIAVPAEIYVEDSASMFFIADSKGRLGNGEFFCPICHQEVPNMDRLKIINYSNIKKPTDLLCEKHNYPMSETCYMQELRGEITARFGKNELVHASDYRHLPSLYGYSKLVSVDWMIQTIYAMDKYNYGVYAEGKVAQIIAMPGETVDSIQRIQGELKRQNMEQQVKGYPKMMNYWLPMTTSDKPEAIPILPPLREMQSIDFYTLYAKAISSVYGVTLDFQMMTEGSKSGGQQPRMKIAVETPRKSVV